MVNLFSEVLFFFTITNKILHKWQDLVPFFLNIFCELLLIHKNRMLLVVCQCLWWKFDLVSWCFIRNSAPQDMPAQLAVTRTEAYGTRYSEDNTNKQVTFRDPVSNSEMDDLDAEGHPNEREPPNNWSSGNSPYQSTLDDPSSSYSPYLPPVLEEPSSSFSEGNALPDIRFSLTFIMLSSAFSNSICYHKQRQKMTHYLL